MRRLQKVRASVPGKPICARNCPCVTVYARLHVYMLYKQVHLYACLHMFVFAYVYVRMHVCARVFVCGLVYDFVCDVRMYMHNVYIYMSVCV
jgi:hypothetical protein